VDGGASEHLAPAQGNAMKSRFVIAIVIASVLVPVLVWAHHVDPRDPNDTRGPLDIKRIDVVRRRTPRFEIIT
jgi:hypothetical protein